MSLDEWGQNRVVPPAVRQALTEALGVAANLGTS